MGIPLVIIHFIGMFHEINRIFWGCPIYAKPPYALHGYEMHHERISNLYLDCLKFIIVIKCVRYRMIWTWPRYGRYSWKTHRAKHQRILCILSFPSLISCQAISWIVWEPPLMTLPLEDGEDGPYGDIGDVFMALGLPRCSKPDQNDPK